jgi:hypothetical protein
MNRQNFIGWGIIIGFFLSIFALTYVSRKSNLPVQEQYRERQFNHGDIVELVLTGEAGMIIGYWYDNRNKLDFNGNYTVRLEDLSTMKMKEYELELFQEDAPPIKEKPYQSGERTWDPETRTYK